jgi:hypothetical protein
MSTIIDALINLDTDHYLSTYKDVQVATKNLSDVDRKLWILNHFVKHGYSEGRRHRLKSSQPAILSEKKPQNDQHKHSKKPSTEQDKPHDVKPHDVKPPDVKPSDVKPLDVKHQHKKDNDDSSDSEHDVQELIKKFRQKHGKQTGGVRDRNSPDAPQPTPSPPKERDTKTKKNFFWEISH